MADISAVSIPNGASQEVYNLKDATAREHLSEYIRGTQETITALWTGRTMDSTLRNGKQIAYFLPYASTGNATLNLTLSNGTTTGTKAIYRYGNTAVAADIPASSVMHLVYDISMDAWFLESYETPKINNVPITGNVSLQQLGLRAVYYDTTANWNNMNTLISEEGAVYIYSDHESYTDDNEDLIVVPGVKIGDGTSYLIDRPFTSDALSYAITKHIGNSSMHVTAAEKQAWNNKVSSYIDGADPENLVLSKNFFVLNGDVMSS